MTRRPKRKVLSRGQIRVDARRAVAKLRQHLLVDLHGYTLEIARAAVIGGATAIAVSHDADDLYIAFDGSPIAADDATRLLDYVLSATDDDEGARLRRLALAVNAALGLEPAHVDLYSRSPDGEAYRVRFDEDAVRDDRDDEDGPRATATSLPQELRVGGQGIHVRRRLGWAVVQRFFSGSVPREVTLMAQACQRLSIPLTISGPSVSVHERSPVVVRAPLALGSGARGFVEIHETGTTAPALDWHERGVHMLATSLALTESLAWPAYDSYLPVSGWVDADELPTNASRSALRDDDPWVREVADEAFAALEDAILALVHAATGQGEAPKRVALLTDDVRTLERALGGVLCAVHASPEPVPEAYGRVLELPLFQDATGKRRSLRWIVDRPPDEPLLALRADAPLPEALHPWARKVVLIRDTIVDRVLLDLNLGNGADHLERAEAGASRRRAMLDEPPSEPTLEEDDAHLFHERFEYDDGPCRGLRGEVALHAHRSRDPNALATFQIHYEGHLLESLVLRRDDMPLPVSAAITWDEGLTPTFDYDGVERDEGLLTALSQVRRLAAHAATELVSRLGGDAMRHAVRAALLADPTLLEEPKLRTASVWPTPDGCWHTTSRVMRSAEMTGALCFVRPGFEGPRAADGRVVLTLAPHEHAALPELIGAGTVTLVPYEAGLSRTADAGSGLAKAMRGAFYEALEAHGDSDPTPPILLVQSARTRAFVAPSPGVSLTWGHVGIPLRREAPSPQLAPTTIAIDDDRVVPSPMWDAVAWPRKPPPTEPLERALFDALVDALGGDAAARARFVRPLDANVLKQKLVRRFLCQVAATLLRREDLDDETRAQLGKLDRIRMLRVLDERGRIRRRTPREVDAAHDDQPIPFLRTRPDFETEDWFPVLVQSDAEHAFLVARFGETRVWDAQAQVELRRYEMEQRRREAEVLARAPIDVSTELVGAHPDSPVARMDGRAGDKPEGGYAFAVALLDDGGAESRCQLLYCGRPIANVPIQAPVHVTARLDVFDASLLEDFERLGMTGKALAGRIVHFAVRQLAELVVGDVDETRVPWWLESTHALELLDHAMTKGRHTLISRALSDVLWPTIQGESDRMRFLAKRGKHLFFGSERYRHWTLSGARLHELDRPVLWMPPPPAERWVRSILVRSGRSLRDVTRAAHKLQQRRKSGSEVGPPELRGEPEHPLLRTRFAKVGITTMSGELELVRSHPSSLDVVDTDGASRRIPCGVDLPIRAVARSELYDVGALTGDAFGEEVGKAAIRHLRALTPKLDELPKWVRGHVRHVVCDLASRSERIANRDRRAPIFEDTRGRFHALDALAEGRVSYTSLASPPGVELRARERVIRLTLVEVSQLGGMLELEDVTPLLRRAEQAERRRAAPERDIALSPEVRSACMAVRNVQAGSLAGVVGLLAPRQLGRAGIAVHVDRRALCDLHDDSGWPVAAVVNDDELGTNDYFDGLASPADADRVRHEVREVARQMMFELTSPPDDALASHRMDWSSDGCHIVGWVWLPSVWPDDPKLRVVRPDQSRRLTRRATVATTAPVRDDLPFDGNLMVVSSGSDIPWTKWDAELSVKLGHLVDALDASDPVALAYRWNATLLGLSCTPPEAQAADGRELEAREVVQALTEHRELWLTDQRGDVDGQFPGDAPPFVLPGGTALAHVLEHRAKVRYLGALPSPAAIDVNLESLDESDDPPHDLEARADVEADGLDEITQLSEPDMGFLQGLKRSVLRLVEEEPPEPTAPSDPLALTFQALLPYLVGLPSELRIAYVQRGRLVRYEPDDRTVLVNRQHACLRQRRGPLDDRACIAIAAAAVAELTREHRVMSEAEERRALLSLLGRLGS